MDRDIITAGENLFRVYAIYGQDKETVCIMKAGCGSGDANASLRKLSDILRHCYSLHHRGANPGFFGNPDKTLTVMSTELNPAEAQAKIDAMGRDGFQVSRLHTRLTLDMMRMLPHMLLMSADGMEQLSPYYIDACASAIVHDRGLALGASRSISALGTPKPAKRDAQYRADMRLAGEILATLGGHPPRQLLSAS